MQDCRRFLPGYRVHSAYLPLLAPTVGGMQAEEAKCLTQLQKENAWLKKLLAEAELVKGML